MRRVPLPTLITAAILVFILVAYAVTFQVRFNEVAVRKVFGRADKNVIDGAKDPGLTFRWPWPIEQIVKYDKRLHALDTPETEVRTADGSNLVVGCYALWRIERPYDFLTSLVTQQAAENTLRSRITKVRQEVIGQHPYSGLFSLDPKEVDQEWDALDREMLAQEAPALKRDYGIDLVEIRIRRNSLPEQATEKVFQSMSDEREAVATGYREQGKAYASSIEGNAKSRADSIRAFADRKAQEIRSAGVQAATIQLQQIPTEDQDIFIWLRQMEALEASLREKATIFFDAKEQLFSLFVAPPKAPAAAIKEQAGAPGGPAPQAPAELRLKPDANNPGPGAGDKAGDTTGGEKPAGDSSQAQK
jgi:modulator of FtsH protease HflC